MILDRPLPATVRGCNRCAPDEGYRGGVAVPRRAKPVQVVAERKQSAAKRAAQDEFIMLVASGHMTKAALGQVGRSPQTLYEQWLPDPEFKRRYTQARAAGGDPSFIGADFIRFRQVYFGNDSPAHHAEFVEAIESVGERQVGLILAPPQAAKTTLIVDKICHILGPVDPEHRICVISEGQDLARNIIGQVSDRMADRGRFAAYIDTWGPFKVDPDDRKRGSAYERDVRRPWNADYLTVLKRSSDEKEPSLESRGAGSKLYGRRYDLIIVDDVQSQETLSNTDKLLAYIRFTAFSRLDKNTGRMIILGTRVGNGDIYEALLNERFVDRLVQIPALRDGRGQPVDLLAEDHYELVTPQDGGLPRPQVVAGCPDVSYWPGRYSMQDLAVDRHKSGESAWAMAYMQMPQDSKTRVFSEEAVARSLDWDRVLGQHAIPVGLGEVACCLDPALGREGEAAYSALEFDAGKLVLLDQDGWKDVGTNEGLFGHIAAYTATFQPSSWVIETNTLQRGIAHDERLRDLAGRMGFVVRDHRTDGSKTDANFGMYALAAAMLRGQVSIPYGDDRTRRKMDVLLGQMRRWQPGVRNKVMPHDRLMSFWFGFVLWLDRRRTVSQAESAFDRSVPQIFQTGLHAPRERQAVLN